MKPIHIRRLRKLIAFLRTLPRKRFNFAIVRTEPPRCGAVGCAIGYLPNVFPKVFESFRDKYGSVNFGTHRVRLRGTRKRYFARAAEWVAGVGGNSRLLFIPEKQSFLGLKDLPETATPKQVARMLEKFIELQTQNHAQ